MAINKIYQREGVSLKVDYGKEIWRVGCGVRCLRFGKLLVKGVKASLLVSNFKWVLIQELNFG